MMSQAGKETPACLARHRGRGRVHSLRQTMQRSRLGRGRVLSERCQAQCLIKHDKQRLRHLIEQRLIKQHKQHKVSRPTVTVIATGDGGVGLWNRLRAIGDATRLGGADEDEDDSIRAAVAAATREKKHRSGIETGLASTLYIGSSGRLAPARPPT